MKKTILSIFLLICTIIYSQDIYVSPQGNDINPGTLKQPFKTIERARDAARKLDEHVTVFLRGGIYSINETIVFTIKDENSTYKPYQSEKPIISSAVPIKKWTICKNYPLGTVEQAKGNLWVADIPEGVSDFKVMFDNDRMLQRAHSIGFQTPELKFKKLATRNVAKREDFSLLKQLPFPDGTLIKWSNPNDVELFFCGVPWTQNIVPVDHVDLENNIAWLKYAGNTPPSTTPKPYNPTYYENSIEVLDTPGEWCVNTQTRKIYYWPINNEPSNNIEVPTLQEFFRVEGNINYDEAADIPVKNVNFEGLTFTKGDRYSWWQGHKGWGIQHDWDKFDHGNAMLRFRGAENCTVSECTFKNSGNSAIRLDLHAQNITIENSLIDRVGHMGILLCGYGPGIKDVNKNNTIVNNLIRRVGEIIWHGHAIFVWQSGENYIANNHIRECPRKAIGICGVRGAIFQNGKDVDWDEAAKTIRWKELKYQKFTKGNNTQEKILPYLHSRNNLVENNYIYRTRTKIGDGASLNVSGAGTGNILRKNMLYMTLGNGMRCDDWQNGTLFENNLILSGGIVHKGKNDLIGNVFINSSIRFSFYPDQQYNPGSQIKNNVFYFTKYIDPYKSRSSKKMRTPESCDVEKNLYYITEPNKSLISFLDKKEKDGVESYSIIKPPGFVKKINLKSALVPTDFNIKRNSNEGDAGVQKIDFGSIGLRTDFPSVFLSEIFPEIEGNIISENAIVQTNSKEFTGSPEALLRSKATLEKVYQVKNQVEPYVQLNLDKSYLITGLNIVADFKDRNNSMRGLTVWSSSDGTKWTELWRADPYHIAMGRDWLVKPNESTQASFIRVGLRPAHTIQLSSDDERGKDLKKLDFYLNSIVVYGKQDEL